MNALRLTRALRGPTAFPLRRCASTASAATSASESSSALPNLDLAPEKPEPEPRIISAAKQATYAADGTVTMSKLSFSNQDELETLTLDGSVFGAAPRVDILHRVVRWQLACRRAGTTKTKSRSEVSGSTRKPWRQKGLGRARVGDIRAPQWRGGYTVHGPQPRDYSYKLPKKVRAMGLRVALSTKLREGKLAIVDSLNVETSKHKEMKELLDSRRWDHALFIHGSEVDENFGLSTRNMAYVDSLPQEAVNVYSILQKDLLVITADAVKYLEDRLHVD